MQSLSFVNALGERIDFNNAPPYIFWKIAGLDLPVADPVFSQSMGQHGFTLHKVLLERRKVRLSGHIHGKSGVLEMYALRRKLQKVLNPLLGAGTLFYRNDAGGWSIPAYCEGTPYGAKIREFQTLDLEFCCPSVFWRTADPRQAGLSYLEGGLEFPLETPNTFGMNSYYAEIDNDGDTEAATEIWIDGGAVNPVITNLTTKEFIKTTQYLYSTLFRFVPGVNRLTFESEDDNRRVRIQFLFYLNYLGV